MEQKGSFIGFTFGNRHSSELGIFRTNKSNRYEIALTPTTVDKVIDAIGSEGQYYYGSNYQKREIPISFAFYGFTEDQLTQVKRIFNDKKIHRLILDEEPYKVWSAKLASVAIIKHLCFEKNNTRFFAGEGEFTFVTYYPYARSRYEYIEDYTEENIIEWDEKGKLLRDDLTDDIIYPGILSYDLSDEDAATIIAFEDSFKTWLEETDLLTNSDSVFDDFNSYVSVFQEPGTYNNLIDWREASAIPSRESYGHYADGKYFLYNAGDVPIPFQLYIPITNTPTSYSIVSGNQKIVLSNIKSKTADSYILIDGNTNIIYGCDNKKRKTKNIYNEAIIEGDFFNLSLGEIELEAPEGQLLFKYLYL